MKKFLIILGIILAVLILIIVAAFLYIRSVSSVDIGVDTLTNIVTQPKIEESSYDHPILDEKTEIILENMGIDTKEIPTTITQDQEDCAKKALGEKRYNELKSGATPNASDIIKAGGCL